MGFISCPGVVFTTTQHKFEEYTADDMQCGDLSKADMLSLGVSDISAKVDPYTLTSISAPTGFNPYNPVGGVSSPTKTISQAECASLMFDEMRSLSGMFATGQYAHLIAEMITHFQNGQGKPFTSPSLNTAYAALIQESSHDNPLKAIKDVINRYLKNKEGRPIRNDAFVLDVRSEIMRTKLPKFDRFSDKFNGLGITVHDIHAQQITINHITPTRNGWTANITFQAQDHFGLDKTDIQSPLYSQFRFFRVWFFLQRYEKFAFKPYMTNFSATVTLEG